MWKMLGSENRSLAMKFGVEFHAFVLMPNHFHLMLTVPEDDLGKVMNVFMSEVTRWVNQHSGRSGHLFGGPYYRSVIQSPRYFGRALKYVYRNPVRAKLCEKVEDYSYSTLHGLLGRSHLPFPLHLTRTGMEDVLPSRDPFELLQWLNEPFPGEIEAAIRKGLRKRVFGNLIWRKTRSPYDAR
jgi:REP element-mobilizing transposase RayT